MVNKPTIPISKKRFNEALRITGFSKNKLADVTGINVRVIKRDVNENERISYERLMKVCKAMNIHPGYLTGENDYIKTNQQSIRANQIKKWPYPENERDIQLSKIMNRCDSDGIYISDFESYSNAQISISKFQSEVDYLLPILEEYFSDKKITPEDLNKIYNDGFRKLQLYTNQIIDSLYEEYSYLWEDQED